jgi:hypothetical protein
MLEHERVETVGLLELTPIVRGHGALHEGEPGAGEPVARRREVGGDRHRRRESGERRRGLTTPQKKIAEIGPDHGIVRGELVRAAKRRLRRLHPPEGSEGDPAAVPSPMVGRCRGDRAIEEVQCQLGLAAAQMTGGHDVEREGLVGCAGEDRGGFALGFVPSAGSPQSERPLGGARLAQSEILGRQQSRGKRMHAEGSPWQGTCGSGQPPVRRSRICSN